MTAGKHRAIERLGRKLEEIGADPHPAGEPVTLLDQDRSRWDFVLIGRGLRALDRPEVGLELVDALAQTGALSDYHLLPSVRGDLLDKLGRHAEAREAFEHAAAQTANQQERAVLRSRGAASARAE